MSRRLVVEPTGFGVRGAVLDGCRVVELVDADALGEHVTDALFVGQVRSVNSRLNAAFVDIGMGEPAFLNAKDARRLVGAEERLPIGRLVQEGQRLVVQGLREGEGGKGPRVTTDLKLFGFHLIYRPHGRVPELAGPVRGRERAELQERGDRLFPDLGFTLRKLASGVDDDTLREEASRLAARWARLETEAMERRRPGPVAGEEQPVERLLRAVTTPELSRIELADAELAARCRRLLETALASHGIELARLDPASSAFEQTEVAGEIKSLLGSEVPLPGGGRIFVETTRACVAIDVDGAGRGALEVDLDAAFEVARQVRLRNLGGTIIVDFVDLPAKAQRQRLEQALKRAFRDDPLPVQILPMSPLGIVQISRARRGQPLAAKLERACPACDGTGLVPSLRAATERLVGDVRRAGSRRVRAAPDLARYLRAGGGAAALATLGGVDVAEDGDLASGAFLIGDGGAHG